jgi:hypothetical protein
MTQGISLQELINQVKKELLAPTDSPDYPLFFVDKVELELTVDVTRGKSGEIGISVLEVVSGVAGKDASQQHGHTIKVTLAPILTREEIRLGFPRESGQDNKPRSCIIPLSEGYDDKDQTNLHP